jgi:hypothetical protein
MATQAISARALDRTGKLGAWLAIASFGVVFVSINGGFSVLGLEHITQAFNEAGRLAWGALSALQIPVPIVVEGLPKSLPLIPWIGVISSSVLQIVVIVAKRSNIKLSPVVLWFALALSLYDGGTTFFGLRSVGWVLQAGPVVQVALTLIFTFSFELVVGFLLPKLGKEE